MQYYNRDFGVILQELIDLSHGVDEVVAECVAVRGAVEAVHRDAFVVAVQLAKYHRPRALRRRWLLALRRQQPQIAGV